MFWNVYNYWLAAQFGYHLESKKFENKHMVIETNSENFERLVKERKPKVLVV